MIDINWNFFFSFWGLVLGTTLVISAFIIPIVAGLEKMDKSRDFMEFLKGLAVFLSPFVAASLFISTLVH